MEEKKTQLQTVPVPIAGFHLRCSFGNIARLLCCNQNCQVSALVCRKQACQCLTKPHSRCDFVYTQAIIEDIQIKKIAIPQQIQKAVDKIDKIYDEAIQKLSIDRDDLQKWKQNYGLSIEEISFLQMIQKNDPQLITGKVVYDVKKAMITFEEHKQLNEAWVTKFWQKSKSIFHKVFFQLTSFTKASQRIPKIIKEKIHYELDFSNAGQRYDYDQVNKIVHRKTSDRQWHQLISTQELPKTGKYYFQGQMYQTRNGYVGIGIVSKKIQLQSKAYDKFESLCYFADGQFREQGAGRLGNAKIPNRSIVRVDVDMDTKQITWTVGGSVLKSTTICEQVFKDTPFYISIQMYYIGDQFKIA